MYKLSFITITVPFFYDKVYQFSRYKASILLFFLLFLRQKALFFTTKGSILKVKFLTKRVPFFTTWVSFLPRLLIAYYGTKKMYFLRELVDMPTYLLMYSSRHGYHVYIIKDPFFKVIRICLENKKCSIPRPLFPL